MASLEIDARLDEIRCRRAAIEGPWFACPDYDGNVRAGSPDGVSPLYAMHVGRDKYIAIVADDDDHAFVVNAPSDIAWLIEEVERLQGEAELDHVIASERRESDDVWRSTMEYENEQAIAVLRQIEWGGFRSNGCPWCTMLPPAHHEGCELGDILDRAR
jgi:hypothetical protein